MKWLAMVCSLLLGTSVTWGMMPSPRVNLEVRVVDEQGEALGGAKVSVGYPGRISGKGESFRKLSDEEGLASFSGSSLFMLPVKAEKEGYYPSFKEVKTFVRVDGENVYSDQEVSLVLREVKNPVPMHVYKFDANLLAVGEVRGFDLVKNDWVAPWGNGIIPDLNLEVTGFFNNYRDNDSTLILSFTNEWDGIQLMPVDDHSSFKSPYMAPLDGYSPRMSWRKKKQVALDPSGKTLRKEIDVIDETAESSDYVFRIRSVLNKEGELVSALYGKIYGHFKFAGASSEGTFIRGFKIYLNPTPNDRNLEFNPDRNEFQGARVVEP